MPLQQKLCGCRLAAVRQFRNRTADNQGMCTHPELGGAHVNLRGVDNTRTSLSECAKTLSKVGSCSGLSCLVAYSDASWSGLVQGYVQKMTT